MDKGIIVQLLHRGANYKARDMKGQTPLDYGTSFRQWTRNKEQKLRKEDFMNSKKENFIMDLNNKEENFQDFK